MFDIPKFCMSTCSHCFLGLCIIQTVGTVPPSITYSLPVIDKACSETRKANNSATSSERPGRPIGILPSDFINSWRALLMSIPDFLANSSVSPSAAFVSINPGATVLTLTPWGLSSFESHLL